MNNKTKTTKQRDIHFASLGNGLTAYDAITMCGGDYKKIAHIDVNRKITWYVQLLSSEDQTLIGETAQNADPNVSATQNQKVFHARPQNS